MSTLTVRDPRQPRPRRVRGKVFGTAERPRLVVFRSNRGIEAQLVDDLEGRTVAAASWLGLKKSFKGSKTEQAAEVGGTGHGQEPRGQQPTPTTRPTHKLQIINAKATPTPQHRLFLYYARVC